MSSLCTRHHQKTRGYIETDLSRPMATIEQLLLDDNNASSVQSTIIHIVTFGFVGCLIFGVDRAFNGD